MRCRRILLLIATMVTWSAPPARATFHLAHISEVHTELDGDVSAQYVEIEMEAILQNMVTNSVLHAWDCGGASLGDLLVVPSDVTNFGDGVKWTMATTSPIGGITSDFLIPGGTLPLDCGQVCWGAPFGIVPPDPGTWDHVNPENYIDCVAYGGYAGTTRTDSGMPTSLSPTATVSLTRVSDTDDNATDFAEGCPTPENNTGEVGGPARACGPATTTTTIGATTTTTLSATIDQPLAGTKLLLKTKPGRPEKSKLVLIAKDHTLSLGAGPGSPEDPTLAGGSFVIASSSPAGAFTGTHGLRGEWKVLGRPQKAKGYKWKSRTSPVRLVLVKKGTLLKARAAGADVGFDLNDNPDPVTVEVTIGSRRYCLEFGGDSSSFKEGKKYLVRKAHAPTACP